MSVARSASESDKVKLTVGVIASAVMVFVLWLDMRAAPAPVSVAVPATPAPELAKLVKLSSPVNFKAVKTYPKAVKRKLDLPAHIQADDNKQVVEASQVPADDHTQTVTTLIDTQTGETSTFVRRDPLPLIAADYSGDAGIYLGLANGAPALKLEARQSFLTVKWVHLGVIGSIVQPVSGMSTPSSTFIGGGLWGGWR
jgi:hypothetical protein